MEILNGKTVLVVDDLSAVRKQLRNFLEPAGVIVLQARDAESALELASEHDIDGFLLDIYLPGGNGMELCQQLRAMERFRHAPMLFVTSSEDEKVLEEAFAAGGDDVLPKPVTTSVLLARLRNHLRRGEHTKQTDYFRRNLNLYVCPRTKDMAELFSKTGVLPPPEEKELCVLFTDVRGFTQLSQEMAPDLLFNVLSDHLGAQVQAVYRYGGYIDKFSGDGLMAVFDGQDMALRACQSALKMIEYATSKAGGVGASLYHVGIGIHMGRAMVGNIGSDKQLDYTVIGPTVNLAARLCGHAQARSVVVSQAVVAALQNEPRLRFSEPMDLQVKGVQAPVTAYRLHPGQKRILVSEDSEIDNLPR
jgi:class 3 adenylate cyclase